MNVVARSNRYVTRRELSVVMVHFRPLPRRLPPRGALIRTTCLLRPARSVGSDRRIGRNGSMPISHILVVYGGLLMNFSDIASGYQRSDLHRYFDDKVAGVRAATAGAEPPSFPPCPAGSSFITFRPVSSDDVLELVRTLPDKRCLISRVCPTRFPPGYRRRTSMSWRHSSVGFSTGLWNVASYRRALSK